jgi:hypothetical protein
MKHVEERDLDGVLKFFRSELGRRWLAAQPKIFQESQRVGQQWGRELAMRVMAELRK